VSHDRARRNRKQTAGQAGATKRKAPGKPGAIVQKRDESSGALRTRGIHDDEQPEPEAPDHRQRETADLPCHPELVEGRATIARSQRKAPGKPAQVLKIATNRLS
jgi:hypothetical protein